MFAAQRGLVDSRRLAESSEDRDEHLVLTARPY
jgi:hypothetical protein